MSLRKNPFSEALGARALALKRLGHYGEAGEVYRGALGIVESAVGRQDPNFAIVLNNYAELLIATGDVDEPAKLNVEVREVLAHTLGESRQLAWALNNFSMLLVMVGDYDAAGPIIEAALAMIKREYGVNHPSYAEMEINYAIWL